MKVEDLASLLGAAPAGPGQWSARCPAHDDQRASLSIGVGEGGRPLVHCFAGCSWDELRAAVPELDTLRPARARHVATYRYRRADGSDAYEVRRYEPKDFRPYHVDAGGRNRVGLGGQRVPYRLPELMAAVADEQTVYVVEGERDADSLVAAGVVATTFPGGAGQSWRPEYAQHFVGAHVVIIPDEDEAGERHADAVAAGLEPVAASVRRGRVAVGKDVSDHLAAGLSVHDLAVDDPPAPAGPETLDEAEATLRRYVRLPHDAYYALLALWAAHTHTHRTWSVTPRLHFRSAERGSGKTRALDIVTELSHDPLNADAGTAAMIRRAVTERPRTLILDECDQVLDRYRRTEVDRHLLALLNSGNRAGLPVVYLREQGSRGWEVAEADLYLPAVLAGLSDLPDTLRSRSLSILMHRPRPDEGRPEPLDYDAQLAIRPLGSRLGQWARGCGALPRPALPPTLVDRPADIWRPIFALADAAGGVWPGKARAAYDAWTHDEQDQWEASAPASTLLLRDVHEIMSAGGSTISAPDLLRQLVDDDSAPWATWAGGREMTAAQLGRMLAPYGVKARRCAAGGKKMRQYTFADVEEAWARYAPAEPLTWPDPPPDSEPEQPSPPAVTHDRPEDPAPGLAAVAALGPDDELAVDVETTGARPYHPDLVPRLVSMAWRAEGEIRTLAAEPAAALPALRASRATPILHNAQYDLPILSATGMPWPDQWRDTIVEAYLLHARDWSKSLGLKELAGRLFGAGEREAEKELKKALRRHGGWAGVPLDELIPYARKDAELTLRLAEWCRDHDRWADAEPAYAGRLELTRVLAGMEAAGIGVDRPAAAEARRTAQARLDELVAWAAPVNLGSPRQVAEWLGVGGSVSRAVLEQLDDPRASAVLEHRTLAKAIGSYYGAWLTASDYPDGRLRPSWSQHSTHTGRLSCRSPNMMTVPARAASGPMSEIKQLIVPAAGQQLTTLDLGQAELWVAAHVSGDAQLAADLRAGDIYQALADQTGLDRRTCKTCVLAGQYGAGADQIAARSGLGVDTAGQVLEAFWRRYPALRQSFLALDEELAAGREIPGTVPGRWYTAADDRYYVGLNRVVQGTVAEIMIQVMLAAARPLADVGGRIVLQVHDSLTVEAPPGAPVAEIVAGGLADARPSVPGLRFES